MFLQAITTKLTHNGSRVKATAQAGSVYVAYDFGMTNADNHRAACEAFTVKFGWADYGTWVGGGTKTGGAFVCVTEQDMAKGS